MQGCGCSHGVQIDSFFLVVVRVPGDQGGAGGAAYHSGSASLVARFPMKVGDRHALHSQVDIARQSSEGNNSAGVAEVASSASMILRISNFWTLPVAVNGKLSTKRIIFGIL